MKKKIILTSVAAVCVVFAAWAFGKVTVTKVEDSCKGCTITALEYKCGMCGTAMRTTYIDSKPYEQKVEYKFTCNNNSCNHTCIYWVKQEQ